MTLLDYTLIDPPMNGFDDEHNAAAYRVHSDARPFKLTLTGSRVPGRERHMLDFAAHQIALAVLAEPASVLDADLLDVWNIPVHDWRRTGRS